MTGFYQDDSGWIPGAGIPVAPPIGRLRLSENAQVRAEFGESRGTNTPVTPSPETRPGVRPVSRKMLAKLDDVMPVRDRRVLHVIAEHRFLSTRQIKRFVFTNHATDESAIRTARVVLSRLERAGMIRSLGRRMVGGVRAGSTAKIWQLAPAGARLLRDDGLNYRTHNPSSRFLARLSLVGDLEPRAARVPPESRPGHFLALERPDGPLPWERNDPENESRGREWVGAPVESTVVVDEGATA